MQHVLADLDRLRTRTRAMLFVQRAAVLAAWILGVAVVLVLLDYALRLPSVFRLVLLAGGLAALGLAVVRYLAAAIGFRPSLTQLALRVEASLPAVRGRLASSVEFARAGLDRENPLAARSVRDTEHRISGASIGRFVRRAPTVRDLGILLAVIAVSITLAVAAPDVAQRGVARLLLPYGSTRWPARTAVTSLMGEVLANKGVHPRGQALPLRAANLTPGDPAGRVDAYFRTENGGVRSSWQHVVLTYQGEGVHERLMDTEADAIELYFATEDARTRPERIQLVPPPALTRASLRITPPAYAEGRRPPLESELGPGIDGRAATDAPSLVGSRLMLTFELNKPLPVPPEAAARAAWVARTFGFRNREATGSPPAFAVLPGEAPGAPERWRLGWRLEGTSELSVTLTDTYGLTNQDPILYRVTAVADLPPEVTITEPQSDQAVLSAAVVDLAGEASDDVGVARIGLAAQVRRKGSDDAEPLAFAPERVVDAETAGIAEALDLARFNLVEGDLVLVTARAEDVFALDGAPHQAVTSAARRLRVIGEVEFAAQLRRQLSAVRQNAIRLESLQSDLQEDLTRHGVQPGLEQAQAQLGDRLADQEQTIDELQQRLERNRLDDEPLAGLLQQSRDLLDYAGRASNRAVEAIETRTAEARTPAPEDRAVADAQQDVREELTDLIELLDRDEDTWIVQRQLESLADAQERLGAETSRLAGETIGQALEDLPEVQLTELERIVLRQRELRDEARRLIEEMRRRAAAMEQMDPRAASGMRTAADTGETREVDRDMETAAQRAGQNQLQSAGAAQQAAATSLRRMLDDLQETRRARAEELLRQLASLIESIQRLVVVQENELIALAGAADKDDFNGRDRAMIRLNQNTQSVAIEARSAGPESRRVARTLDRAADAQGAAVVALRAQPREPEAAREAEKRSLALLKEAQKLAAEVQEKTRQKQVREQREALIEAYRGLEEKQVALREAALELAAAGPLDRRGLVEARRIGNGQQEIRTGLSDVEARTGEIVDSEIFSFVHHLMDRWSSEASDALWEGQVDVEVTDRQQRIADSIARQIEALEESMQPPAEFAEERQGGQGGTGGGPPPPLIPPVAEVRRLHGLQEQVYDETRGIDQRTDLSPAQRRQRVRDLGRLQRQLIKLGEGMLEKMNGGAGPAPGEEDSPSPK